MAKFPHTFLLLTWILLSLGGCQSVPSVSTAAQLPLQHAKRNHEAQERLDLKKFYQLKQQTQRPIVALVLGSGGARGYAHIGVIDILEKSGIQPDFIVGTSAGSIVGSLYASGKSAQQLKDIALAMKVNDVRDLTFNLKGFFEGRKVENYINQKVNHQQLQELKIPMYVVATELKEGRKTVFNYGNTGQAVRASISIPSMFIPTQIGHEEYVDGGLVSPVPVDVARRLGADIIIAVDILAQPEYTSTTNIWGLFNQNINIMQKNIADNELQYADIIIRPDLREKNHIFDVKDREKIIDAGAEAALAQLPLIGQIYASNCKKIEKNQEQDNLKYYVNK
ncbi:MULTISPECIES: patatin-like phospholipase family protein [unclassified Acinetobacter]|uniref:patatin-like phospholipase family protein n=1 Tax=unclassified Acinetobacter TaxID=196816 RepID=UPI00293476C0|nr:MULTISPECIES: patatin-like phospholipase family protein [unclassified Acinetobacter]WOE32723.1 patatin-like phospholipase family protein [Acinetobacter sp. SAAs470]WOE38199.1 patatin-like phospholipase family protein [Acinetobacter sp. SAAs474]